MTLFGRDRTVITKHINNIFKEGELEREEVCAKFAHTTIHGAIKGKSQIQPDPPRRPIGFGVRYDD